MKNKWRMRVWQSTDDVDYGLYLLDGLYGTECQAMLAKLKDKDVVVTVTEWKPYTSKDQYGYYYGIILPMISDEVGHSVEELDVILKNKFLYEYIKIGDELIKKPRSKTAVTTMEFSTYIEEVVRWAATVLSVVIPDPS